MASAEDETEDFSPLTDDLKTKLQELITSDLRFVDCIKDIACRHCDQIPIFHYIFPCKHPYCRECYLNYRTVEFKCRVCKTEIGHDFPQSKKIEMAIYKLRAICPNQLFGCPQVVSLVKLTTHLKKCRFDKKYFLPVLYTEKITNNGETSDAGNISLLIADLISRLIQLENIQKLSNDHEKLNPDVPHNEDLKCEIKKLKNKSETLEKRFIKLVENIDSITTHNGTLLNENSELVEHNRKLANEFGESARANSKLTDYNYEITKRNQELVAAYTESVNQLKKLSDLHVTLAEENKELFAKYKRQAEENEELVRQNVASQQEFKRIAEDLTEKCNGITKELNLLKEFHKNEDPNAKKIVKKASNLSTANTAPGKSGATIKQVTKKSIIVGAAATKTTADKKTAKPTVFRRSASERENAGWLTWETGNYLLKKSSKMDVNSDIFRSTDGRHQMVLRMSFGSDLHFRLRVVPNDAAAACHALFRMTLLVLDQSPDVERHRPITYVLEPTFTDKSSASLDSVQVAIPFYSIESTENAYLVNNTIRIKALVEPIGDLLTKSNLKMVKNRTGTLLWTVENYERTKQESILLINKYVRSDYFYTTPVGYRIQARMHWWSQFLKISFAFLPGEFDHLLPAPPVHRCTVTLVGRNDDGIEVSSVRSNDLEACADMDKYFVFFRCVNVEDKNFLGQGQQGGSLTFRIAVTEKVKK